jgi:hypothetical protein
MTICLSLSFKYFFVLFPRLHARGAVLAFVWLGVCLSVVQRPAAGIITPEQMPLLLAMQKRLNERADRQERWRK